MSAILFYLVRFIWYLMSLLPFRVLYFISDVLYYPVYYIIGYRRKVVRKNLTNSFPEKNLDDVIAIEKKFYHALCDYFVETIKFYGMSKERVQRRMQFTGLEEVNAAIERGQSVVVYMAHTFNWEFATSMPLWLNHDNLAIGQIYHPLENKLFDDFFKKLRNQYGAENIPMASTLRRIVQIGKEGKQFIIGFIADQVPTWEAINHWVTFFHQETPVFTGTEKIAHRTRSAVFFLRYKRLRRGKYIGHFEPMVDDASQLQELELTNLYYKLLEDSITESPELWLWTHNRWKRTRQGKIERERKRIEGRRLLAEKERLAQENNNGNV